MKRSHKMIALLELLENDSDDDSRTSNDSDCTLLSNFGSSRSDTSNITNGTNSRMMADEYGIAGAPTAKRFKNSSTSSKIMVSSEQSESSSTASHDLSQPTNLPPAQPKVKLVRLNKQQINEYLNPSINKKTKNDASGKLKAKSKSKNNTVMDLNVENEIDIETDQTHRIDASTHVNGTCQRDPDSIDYKSWQWQPKLQLSKLSQDDLKGIERYQPNENRNPDISWLQVNPIEFDKEQSLIRELSPQAANQQFRKRLSAIKNASQLGTVHAGIVVGETSSKKHYHEYEEAYKELQSKKRPTGRSGIRKLYSPATLDENDDSKATMVLTPMKGGKKRTQRDAKLDVDMVRTRSSMRLNGLQNK